MLGALVVAFQAGLRRHLDIPGVPFSVDPYAQYSLGSDVMRGASSSTSCSGCVLSLGDGQLDVVGSFYKLFHLSDDLQPLHDLATPLCLSPAGKTHFCEFMVWFQ